MSALSDYQAGVLALSDATASRVVGALESVGPAGRFIDLVDVTAPIVEALGEVSAVVSADFYDAAREEASARGVFAATPAAPPDIDRVRAAVGWGLREGAESTSRLALIQGALVRSVLGSGRDTVRNAVASDAAATGWRRIARPGACDFCRMLAGRGEVYRKDTARFGSHDTCHCLAAPAFSGGLAVTVAQHLATQRTVSAADRARLREHLAQVN